MAIELRIHPPDIEVYVHDELVAILVRGHDRRWASYSPTHVLTDGATKHAIARAVARLNSGTPVDSPSLL